MNPIAACAEEALRAHPHPALRLSELVEIVADRVDRGLEPARLRAALEDHPDRFTILEPWSGPWRGVDHPGLARPAGEPWIVGVTVPDSGPDTPPFALKMRESVRWLSRGVDPGSSIGVSRWYAIVLAERAARAAVARRAS